MSVQDEEDGPTLASAMRQAAYSTYWAAVSAIIGSQASDMGCAHPGRTSDEEEYSDGASDDWDRGHADPPAVQRGASGVVSGAGVRGDGAHLVAEAGSRPGSADSAHLLSSDVVRPPGSGPGADKAAEVGPQVDPEPLVPGTARSSACTAEVLQTLAGSCMPGACVAA